MTRSRHRHRRILLNVGMGLSLLLLLATLALWARSYFVADVFRWSSNAVFASRGDVGFSAFASSPFRGLVPLHHAVRPAPPNPTGWLGFGSDQEGAAVIITTYYFPLWFFAAAFASIGILCRARRRAHDALGRSAH
ncbi:MAG TPA: hypothetical protein VH475_25755 [Tepidisphaeraceae bacterium]